VAFDNRPTRTHQLLRGVQHVVRNPQTPSHVPSGRLIRLSRPHGRLLDTRHLGRGPRLLHGKSQRRALAPRLPPDGLVRVRLLLMQAHADVHQLPAAGSYATDRQAGDTPQAIKTIPTQRPLARCSPIALHGRFTVHGQLARGSSSPMRPRRGPTTLARPPAQPRQRPLGAHTGGRPPQPYDRPLERRISSSCRQAISPLQKGLNATRPRSDHRPLAIRETTSGVRGKSAISLPRHRASTFLPP
jgi:hypothetical protein